MIDFDRETWIYLLIIAAAITYFLWNKGSATKLRKHKKNRKLRMRYLERKKNSKSTSEVQ
ncbi:hypothetical protein [Gillisia hiemivivida]|jgi:hypothetical protein|uniref:Uncharacterized protein n=1 Tax=Gillisia hiemivivida TaxID=291190 RepID=A0A5C6ZTH1_9FLAO|nr:hypothetical protein [Gillisia hiemivivida]TXD93858.1 hypothetical protein ES724_07985 [Gillisia hiemivivida]